MKAYGGEERWHVAGVEVELSEVLRPPPQRLGVVRRIAERCRQRAAGFRGLARPAPVLEV
jgi:hypothetical protein